MLTFTFFESVNEVSSDQEVELSFHGLVSGLTMKPRTKPESSNTSVPEPCHSRAAADENQSGDSESDDSDGMSSSQGREQDASSDHATGGAATDSDGEDNEDEDQSGDNVSDMDSDEDSSISDSVSDMSDDEGTDQEDHVTPEGNVLLSLLPLYHDVEEVQRMFLDLVADGSELFTQLSSRPDLHSRLYSVLEDLQDILSHLLTIGSTLVALESKEREE